MKPVVVSGRLTLHSRTALVTAVAVARADRVWNVAPSFGIGGSTGSRFATGGPGTGAGPTPQSWRARWLSGMRGWWARPFIVARILGL